MAVHPVTGAAAQDGSAEALADGTVDRSGHSGWEWDQDDLVAFAVDAQDRWPWDSPRASMLAPVASKIRRPRRPSIATSAKSLGLVESRLAQRIASNWRWFSPRVGDSGGT